MKNDLKNRHKNTKKVICLALQGGGVHGVFTWGVVDRLLEEKDICIEGISGASAGGMNAAAIVQGLIKGENAGARAEMRRYWELIMESSISLFVHPAIQEMTSKIPQLADFPYIYIDLLQDNFRQIQKWAESRAQMIFLS